MQYTFHYHSNGSFLLTGEYLVSEGSQAIVLPLKIGQTLVIEPINKNLLVWEDVYNEETLFKAVYSTDQLEIIESTDGEEALFVGNVLKKAMDHLASLSALPGHYIRAKHNYSLHMDPGTRSALISSIAEWFNINPFRLNQAVMQDAGYGIACARSSKPILYRMVDQYHDYRQISIDPPFKNHIYFVYTGEGTDFSEKREKVKHSGNLSTLFSEIREINEHIIMSRSLEDFEQALLDYEQLFSRVMNEKSFQEREFSDFSGVIKPLITNNGQFLLVTWKGTREALREYFGPYNLPAIFQWDELIMNEE